MVKEMRGFQSQRGLLGKAGLGLHRAPVHSGLEPALGKGTGAPGSRSRQIPMGWARGVPQGSLRAADPCKSCRSVRVCWCLALGLLGVSGAGISELLSSIGLRADNLVSDSLPPKWCAHLQREGQPSPPPSPLSLSPGEVTQILVQGGSSFQKSEVGLGGFQPQYGLFLFCGLSSCPVKMSSQ